MRFNNRDDLLQLTLKISTQSNIYDGAFIAKIESR